MFFLAGMDKKYEPIEPPMSCHCSFCGVNREWVLYKETELASLFFITIWRFTPDYLLVCGSCQYPMKLPRELGKQLALDNSQITAKQDELASLVAEHQKVNITTNRES
ncbi:hypothetical protein [Shewanella woodyi]|uniref:hypothetical protein n=1 Tax=Shewanella woodyi TaxID=60961 RepID=UPI0037480E32